MSLAPPKPAPVQPGFRLDRYELLAPVADGGMASVWLARQHGKRGFEKLVAVKMILPKYAQDPRFEKMFLDEAGIASRITHPNVAQILDLGDEHGVLYLAMEWVDGDPVSKLRRKAEKKNEKIPLRVVLRILADTCGGLHAAHELRGKDDVSLGVVHRDVSQQNILVDTLGSAKVIDFGIAKARDRVTEETTAGMLKGKIHCMAPEQARGEQVDRRADVFAVGSILYHLIAGAPPYEGDNELATLSLLISGKPPPPLPPDTPAAVSEVVMRALSHKREGRYSTAAQMRDAIEAAMIQEKLTATTSDVATYCGTLMADRMEKRKEAMAYALSAAGDRAQVARILQVDSSADSSSGVVQANAKLEGAFKALRSTLQTLPEALPVPPARKSAPALPAPAPIEPTPLESRETSAPTYGAAALELPVPRDGRRRVLAIAGGLAAVCAAGALLLAVGHGGGTGESSPGTAVSAATTAPTASPAASASAAPAALPTVTTAVDATAAVPSVAPSATASLRVKGPVTPPRQRPAVPQASHPVTPDLGSYR